MHRIHLLTLLATAAIAPLASANLIVNGSLTGPTGEAVAPAGWSGYTVETVAPGGLASTSGPGGTFAFLIPPSSDGGTFILGAGPSSVSFAGEILTQTVTGLSAGLNYAVNFEYANGGWYQGTSAYVDEVGDGYFEVQFGPGVQNTAALAFLGFGQQTWHSTSMVFTAGASSEVLTFTIKDLGSATRMALDGVSVDLVPAPGTCALAALLGIWPRRSKRAPC